MGIEINNSQQTNLKLQSKIQLVELNHYRKLSIAEQIKMTKAMISRRKRRWLKMLRKNPPLVHRTSSCTSNNYISNLGTSKQRNYLVPSSSQKITHRSRRFKDEFTVAIPFFLGSYLSEISNYITDLRHASPTILDFHYFAVFDGQGESLQAAEFCKNKLHGIIAEETMKSGILGQGCAGDAAEWVNLMKTSFAKAADHGAIFSAESTALTAVIGPEVLVMASCGGSRALLVRRGGAGVYVSNELASIKNKLAHAELEVNAVKRRTEDIFLILATDGLWDVLSNDLVSTLANETLSSCQTVIVDLHKGNSPSQFLVNLLKNCAIAKKNNNNISIVVVDLR